MNFDRVSQMDEAGEKRARLTRAMKERGLDAVVLSRRHNFSWASGGSDNHVRHSADMGVATLIFTRDGARYVLTSNIEAPRIMDEELGGMGYELKTVKWYVPEERAQALKELMGGRKAASDDGTPGTVDAEPLLMPLRMQLGRNELAKYRWLGRAAGRGIAEVCRKITRGMTEEEIAGNLFAVMQGQGVKPTVLLVAADERIKKYRHPIPTAQKVKGAVMLVLCARRWGLVTSTTRIVGFGRPSDEVKYKHEACTFVDACFIAASRPGVPLVDVFNRARAAYGERGYPDEWQFHHQGGPTGYIEREFTVNPSTDKALKVGRGMAIAWNPSIAGTKSEDTILVTPSGTEVITASPGWPMLKVRVEGRTVARPDWLIKP